MALLNVCTDCKLNIGQWYSWQQQQQQQEKGKIEQQHLQQQL
jgi:ribosome-binding protein aMBF1 (putative translation factor)